MMNIKAVSLLFLVLVLVGSSTSKDCPTTEDYTPCACSSYDYGLMVSCINVPLSAVQEVFSRTTQILDFNRLWLSPMWNETHIPAHLTNDKRFSFITLSCHGSPLTVDVDAFRSSQDYTETVLFDSCNFMNLESIKDFRLLKELKFRYASDLGRTLETLPPLKSLSYLNIEYSQGLGELGTFPTLVNPLEKLDLYYSTNLTNEATQLILEGVAQSSTESLQYLNLMYNYLTVVPPSVASFKNLATLRLDYNIFPVIESHSLPVFANQNVDLVLSVSEVNTIQPGSFRGNFNNGTIHIDYNQLTRFESSVFKDVLEGMSESSGSVDIFGNPIDCINDSCHLAWLIRDNRHLLPHVISGSCLTADGERLSFEQLNPDDFADCLTV